MPMYEYECRKCGHEFQHLARRISEPAPGCPECGTGKPRKKLSVFSAVVAAPAYSGGCAPAACAAGDGPCANGGGCPGRM